jgi:hypothetical protein
MAEQLNQGEQNFDAAAKKKSFFDRFRIPYDENRRNAIKAGAVLGAGLVVGELAGCTPPEKNREQLVEELVNGKTDTVTIVPQNTRATELREPGEKVYSTISEIQEKIGRTDIGKDTYIEAVHRLNEGYNFGEDGITLQAGPLRVPIKE